MAPLRFSTAAGAILTPRSNASSSSSYAITPISSLLTKRLTNILHLRPRQQSATPEIIPTTYGNLNSGPAPGTVIGIVLGSVGGLLLLMWLFYTCFNIGRTDDSVVEEVVVKNRRKRNSRGKSHPAFRILLMSKTT